MGYDAAAMVIDGWVVPMRALLEVRGRECLRCRKSAPVVTDNFCPACGERYQRVLVGRDGVSGQWGHEDRVAGVPGVSYATWCVAGAPVVETEALRVDAYDDRAQKLNGHGVVVLRAAECREGVSFARLPAADPGLETRAAAVEAALRALGCDAERGIFVVDAGTC